MTLHVGDQVIVDGARFPGVWTIIKVNPTTYKLQQPSSQRRLNAHHSLVRAVSADAPAEQQRFEPLPTLHAGQLVRWDDARGAGKLYVVLADKVERVNVALLGGENGRYWRVNPRSLTVVDPASVLVSTS